MKSSNEPNGLDSVDATAGSENAIGDAVLSELDELVRERAPELAAALERVGERPAVALGLAARARDALTRSRRPV